MCFFFMYEAERGDQELCVLLFSVIMSSCLTLFLGEGLVNSSGAGRNLVTID